MRVIYIVVFVTLVWLYVCWSCYWAYHEDPSVVTRTISTTSTTTATAITDVDANGTGVVTHGAPSRLDPAILLLLPAFVYSAAAAQQGERLECAVCLAEFADEEKGRTLPGCGHSFHKDCIDVWFGAHSTCPICRAPVGLEGGGCEGSDLNV